MNVIISMFHFAESAYLADEWIECDSCESEKLDAHADTTCRPLVDQDLIDGNFSFQNHTNKEHSHSRRSVVHKK